MKNTNYQNNFLYQNDGVFQVTQDSISISVVVRHHNCVAKIIFCVTICSYYLKMYLESSISSAMTFIPLALFTFNTVIIWGIFKIKHIEIVIMLRRFEMCSK